MIVILGVGAPVIPQGGAVDGIECRDAILGEDDRPGRPGNHSEQAGGLPGPCDIGADAGGAFRQVRGGGGRRV